MATGMRRNGAIEQGHRSMLPMPTFSKVIAFLGYYPYPVTTTGEQLLMLRRKNGWTLKQAAQKLGVDPCTWSDWVSGGTIMLTAHRRMIARFLGLPEGELHSIMRKRWNDSHGRSTRG